MKGLFGTGDSPVKVISDIVDDIHYSKEERAKDAMEQNERLQELDKEAFEESLKAYVEMESLVVEDRKSAREANTNILTSIKEKASKLSVNINSILAIMIVLFGFALCFVLVFKRVIIDSDQKEILLYVIGAVTSWVGSIIGFYFGGTRDNRFSDAVLKKINKE